MTDQQRQSYQACVQQGEESYVTILLAYAQAHDKAKGVHYAALAEPIYHKNLIWAMEHAYKHQMWPEVLAFVRAIGLPEHGYLAVNGYWGEVKKRLEQALKAAEVEQDAHTALQMGAEYAWLLYKMGQTVSAHSLLQEILAAWEENEDPDPDVRQAISKQIAGLHGRLAVIAQTEGDSKQQGYHLQQRRQIYTQLNDSENLAYAYANQADQASHQGDIGTAARLYQQAHVLFATIGNESGIANVTFKMGMLAQRMGLAELADDLLSSSIQQKEASNNKQGIANLKLALGSQREEEGDWTKAEQIYQESLRTYQELGDKPGEAQALLMLGHLCLESEQWDRAQQFLMQARNLYQEINDQPGIAQSCGLLGRVALAQGDLVTAETYAQQSLVIGQKLQKEYIEATAYIQLSAIAAAKGNGTLCLNLRREGLERLSMRDDLPPDLRREIYQELDLLFDTAPPRGFKQYLGFLKRFFRTMRT